MKKVLAALALLSLVACTSKPVASGVRIPADDKGTGDVGSSDGTDIQRTILIQTRSGPSEAILDETCIAFGGVVSTTEEDKRGMVETFCDGGDYRGKLVSSLYYDSDCKNQYAKAQSYFDQYLNSNPDELSLLTVASRALEACQNFGDDAKLPAVSKILRDAEVQCRKNMKKVSHTWVATCYLKAADYGQHALQAYK